MIYPKKSGYSILVSCEIDSTGLDWKMYHDNKSNGFFGFLQPCPFPAKVEGGKQLPGNVCSNV